MNIDHLENAPIEDVLNEIIPDWREQAKRLANEGLSDLEITAEFRKQMMAQMDDLLDAYNALTGKES